MDVAAAGVQPAAAGQLGARTRTLCMVTIVPHRGVRPRAATQDGRQDSQDRPRGAKKPSRPRGAKTKPAAGARRPAAARVLEPCSDVPYLGGSARIDTVQGARFVSSHGAYGVRIGGWRRWCVSLIRRIVYLVLLVAVATTLAYVLAGPHPG